MERSTSIFCTNRHTIDITTVYCSLVGLNTSLKGKTMEIRILHRHLIFILFFGTTDIYSYC